MPHNATGPVDWQLATVQWLQFQYSDAHDSIAPSFFYPLPRAFPHTHAQSLLLFPHLNAKKAKTPFVSPAIDEKRCVSRRTLFCSPPAGAYPAPVIRDSIYAIPNGASKLIAARRSLGQAQILRDKAVIFCHWPE